MSEVDPQECDEKDPLFLSQRFLQEGFQYVMISMQAILALDNSHASVPLVNHWHDGRPSTANKILVFLPCAPQIAWVHVMLGQAKDLGYARGLTLVLSCLRDGLL